MRKLSHKKWMLLVCLLTVGFLGAYFRFTGINWDQDFHLHPDERFLTMIETSIRTEDSIKDYFDTENSTLNPHNVRDANGNQTFPFFVYGSFPIFLVRFIGETIGQTNYSQIHIVGRYLSGIFDMGTLLVIFLIGRKMFKSSWVGVISAALYAFAPLPIQISHFFIVDHFTTFFATTAFLFAVEVFNFEKNQRQMIEPLSTNLNQLIKYWDGIWNFIFFGIALGLAAASKVNAVVIALMLPLSVLLAVRNKENIWKSLRLHIVLRNLVIAALVSFLAFRIFQPYAFSGPSFFNFGINPEWLNDIKELRSLSSGLSSYPPSLQWTRRNILFPFKNMTIWGMGIAFGFISFISLFKMLIDFIKGKKGAFLLLLTWNIAYTLWQALRWNPTMRYFLLVYPTLAVSAGWFLLIGIKGLKLKKKTPRGYKVLRIILIIGVLAVSLGWGFAFINIYRRPMTRIAASEWIYKNIEGPINLIYQAEDVDYSQPIPYRKAFTLASDETVSIDFFVSEDFSADEIVIEHVLPSDLQGEQYLEIAILDQINNMEIYKGNLLLPGNSTMDQRGAELVIPLSSPVHFNKDHDLTISISNTSANIPIRFMGALQLRNTEGEAWISKTVFTFSQRLTPNSVFETSFTPLESGKITGVEIFRVRSDKFQGPEIPISVEIIDSLTGNVISSGQAEISRDAPINSRGETIRIPLDNSLTVDKDKSYEIVIRNKNDQGILFISGNQSAKETDWDDSLPLFMYGLNPFDLYSGIYQSDLNFQMYWDDNYDKLTRFVSILDQADTIIISSNRQWGSVTQAEEKYPLSTHLYRGLIDCEEDDVQTCYINAEPDGRAGVLGFELVETFTADPELFGVTFNSQNAEEAFSVYDHPKVFIFRKTDAFSFSSAVSYLRQIDLNQVLNLSPQEIEKRPGLLLLPENRWNQQKESGTWSKLFNSDAIQNRSEIFSVVAWYLFISLFGWLMTPLTRIVFSGLRHKGWGLSRLFGLLLLGYFVWLGGSLGVTASRGFILLVAVIIFALNGYLFYRDRKKIIADLKSNKASIFRLEFVFLGLFLFFLAIRMGNPDLWHPYKGGEKPMDFAYFNAVIKSIHFPPYDPWYAGGYINYYYWGFVLGAVPTKLLGITPSIAYNLLLPTFFAMTGIGAYTIGVNLVKPSKKKELFTGLLAVMFVLFIGNLGTVKMIMQGFQRLGELQISNTALNGFSPIVQFFTGVREYFRFGRFNYYPGDWYWIPSRAIPGEPITEFPFFTFLYGDPHAHLFAYPVTLLSICWALSVFYQKWLYRFVFNKWAGILGGALIVGVLQPINTWDLPVFLVINIAVMVYTYIRYSNEIVNYFPRISGQFRKIIEAAFLAIVFVCSAFLLFSPFSRWYGQGYSSFALWDGTKTSLGAYFTHWGIFLFIIISWLVLEVIAWMKATPLSRVGKWRDFKGWFIFTGIVLLGLWAFLLIRGIVISLVAVPIALIAFLLSFRKEIRDSKRFALLLISLGIGLMVLVELIVLSGDIGRMNTVFKFYLQAWTCISLGASYALYSLIQNLQIKTQKTGTAIWRTFLILLVLSGMQYPIIASVDKISDRMAPETPITLDGMDFMQYAQYPEENVMMDLAQDYRLIRWMQENIEGTPRIIEAHVPEYRWGSRISIYTGLPTVIGWNWHQRQQRTINPAEWIYSRVTDVQDFYSTTDWNIVYKLLDQYKIEYIIIGQLERIVYPKDGIEKFTQSAPDSMFDVMYDESDSLLLKVNRTYD